MNRFFLCLLLMIPVSIIAQTSITIDASVRFQTIHGFGASDAWNTDFVGKYWATSVKTNITKKLFAKTFDGNGNPEGIGLSRWRFNIGAGSSEQGSASNIEMEERRVECFLNENGTYNWSKQKGQQWFLEQAKSYGVEQLVAFINSPPRFYTKSGRANSDNSNDYGSTNLKDTCYDEFANFIATVLKHFNDNGTPFAQISPVNEPQFAWGSGQEGCPWTNLEIKKLIGELNTAIVNNGLSTKILIAEAGSYKNLYQTSGDANKSNQITGFFDASNAAYIGDNSQLMRGLGAHSYWTDSDDATIKSVRQAVYNKSLTIDNFEVYQTEYNLLSQSYSDYYSNALFLGKMIYSDLAIANVSIWDYWTAIERERWDQLNRFYLIRLNPTGGDYGVLTTGGSITVNKNLWVLGNYSLFIRPGYKRIGLSGADNLAGLMGTAFIAPDSSRIVIVYVNYGSGSVNVAQTFNSLPNGAYIKKITPYLTNANYNMKVQATVDEGTTYKVNPLSVTTLVVDLGNSLISIDPAEADPKIEIFPNPTTGLLTINTANISHKSSNINILNTFGKIVCTRPIIGDQSITIDISAQPSGIYFVQTSNGVLKIVKQ